MLEEICLLVLNCDCNLTSETFLLKQAYGQIRVRHWILNYRCGKPSHMFMFHDVEWGEISPTYLEIQRILNNYAEFAAMLYITIQPFVGQHVNLGVLDARTIASAYVWRHNLPVFCHPHRIENSLTLKNCSGPLSFCTCSKWKTNSICLCFATSLVRSSLSL